jgi:hypothetical protein
VHGVIADAFEWLMFDPDRPGFDYLMEWDWNVEPFQMKKAEKIYNATDPNLLDVMLRGKKILMYHGWSDPAANAVRTIRYRESVVDFLADKLHLKRRLDFVAENLTDRFLKLYLVPAWPIAAAAWDTRPWTGFRRSSTGSSITARRRRSSARAAPARGRTAPTRRKRYGPVQAARTTPPTSCANGYTTAESRVLTFRSPARPAGYGGVRLIQASGRGPEDFTLGIPPGL